MNGSYNTCFCSDSLCKYWLSVWILHFLCIHYLYSFTNSFFHPLLCIYSFHLFRFWVHIAYISFIFSLRKSPYSSLYNSHKNSLDNFLIFSFVCKFIIIILISILHLLNFQNLLILALIFRIFFLLHLTINHTKKEKGTDNKGDSERQKKG